MSKEVKFIGSYNMENAKGITAKTFIGNDSQLFMGKEYKEGFNVNYTAFGQDKPIMSVEFSHILPAEVNFIGKHDFELKGKKLQLVYMTYYEWKLDIKSKDKSNWHIKPYNKETCYLFQVLPSGELKPLCCNVKPNTVISAIRIYDGNTSHSTANNIYVEATLRRARFKKSNSGRAKKTVEVKDLDFTVTLD